MLVNNYVEYYARNYPDNPCLTRSSSTLTYSDIDLQANLLANGLLKLGVTQGQRVAVLGENGIEHPLLIMAAGKIGAVTVSINCRLAPAEVAFIINDSQSKALIVLDDSMSEKLEQLSPLLPTELILLTHNGHQLAPWDEWLSQQDDRIPNVTVDPNGPFLQIYTSGTTGNPKGAVLSHTNLLALCAMHTTQLPHRGNMGMADIICAPLFHIGGVAALLIALYSGCHVILHKSFNPEAIVSDIENYPANSLFLVPAMIMAILSLPDIEQRDFSSLKQVLYGAAPISESVLRRAMEVFNADFLQVYGMTETGGTVINLSAADHQKALRDKPELLKSCGRPSVGGHLRVVDGKGEDVPVGEVGEVWLKSDTNMLHYHNLPEETAKNLTDGWMHTGDAGYLDDEGYLYLKDRVKDMVVSGGENIYPVEVENAVANHPAIADVAIIGIPDEKFGEALLCITVLKPGQSLTIEELIEFCRSRIAGYKIPRQMKIVDVLPRNPSGKVLKKDLRKPYWEGVDRQIG